MKAQMCCYLCDRPAHSRHHIFPVVHFGRRKNKTTFPLCRRHHLIADTAILIMEAFFGGKSYGTRFKLKTPDYYFIANVLGLQ